jgi:hypothetical protein
MIDTTDRPEFLYENILDNEIKWLTPCFGLASTGRNSWLPVIWNPETGKLTKHHDYHVGELATIVTLELADIREQIYAIHYPGLR